MDTPTNEPSSTFWVDNDERIFAGDHGFVIRQHPEGKEPRTIIRAKPGRDCETNARILAGDLGRGAAALGVGVVLKINPEGDRAKVQILDGHDLKLALEELGHPEIAP